MVMSWRAGIYLSLDNYVKGKKEYGDLFIG